MKKLFIIFSVLVMIWLSGKAFAGAVTLQWDNPTQNTDGTPITDLAGCKVYWGDTTGTYTDTFTVVTTTPGAVETVTIDLGPDTEGKTYYMAVTAYDALMNESDYSNEVVVNFPLVAPLAPSGVTVTGQTN